MISSIIFIALFIGASALFTINIKKIRKNILLGRDVDLSGNKDLRLKNMMRVALGQGKMVTRPVSAVMHILVYVGFILINIEVVEMLIDGAFHQHRALSFLGGFYTFLISFFEVLAFLVFVGVVVFWFRRNVIKVKRFTNPELKGFPARDANIILVTEMVLMTCLFLMNGADQALSLKGAEHYKDVLVSPPLSSLIVNSLSGLSEGTLITIERTCWWLHMVGILAFLNYLPYSKHLHILLAFPNTYFFNINKKGKFTNLQEITDVVKPNFDPSYVPVTDPNASQKFGAKDVTDLNWKQLLDAYTCTECGRCTSSCPQNITGKKLSPRKIMMDTRDRLDEVGKNCANNGGVFKDDGKSLLGDYITAEELWACNTCNACVQECPVNIDPLSIIVDLRRYLVMEQSSAPSELNNMFTNMENNGAPWQFSPSDRANWINEN